MTSARRPTRRKRSSCARVQPRHVAVVCRCIPPREEVDALAIAIHDGLHLLSQTPRCNRSYPPTLSPDRSTTRPYRSSPRFDARLVVFTRAHPIFEARQLRDHLRVAARGAAPSPPAPPAEPAAAEPPPATAELGTSKIDVVDEVPTTAGLEHLHRIVLSAPPTLSVTSTLRSTIDTFAVQSGPSFAPFSYAWRFLPFSSRLGGRWSILTMSSLKPFVLPATLFVHLAQLLRLLFDLRLGVAAFLCTP